MIQTVEEALAYVYQRIGKQAPIGKSVGINATGLMRSFVKDDGDVGIEGWISTPTPDIEKDILEAIAFSGESLRSYMQRGAPVSTEHNTHDYAVGYLTKSVLINKGEIIQEEVNPKHEFDRFRYFDGGSGWYGAGVIFEPNAKRGVVNGTVGSFSWIGMPKIWEPIKGGGRHFKQAGGINPLIEVTITSYPINTTATMRIAKARGALPVTTLSDLAMLMSTDDDIARDVIDLLVPGIKDRASQSFSDVLDLASMQSQRTVHDYFRS